ncbi:PTS sugar transporter subunit IIA [Jinshanibacter sp. LJY008]|uniref:PTS sugar transporter subunit IIA n=1 Tax=Limnobaculum eriocheiris TaxID=2897391 RepID=A0A9X1SJW6_9GAMM|nr:PTS galactosamine/N-acetylgalactosamine transporter subunit IIA [Limnobaculum eriocheiris]MCD1125331.1 PTS sugar transporter subunit IIA [Limnobaculum eriocheiris]
MIGIVVSGHIHFASGMQSAMQAIAGEQKQMVFIDFTETLSTDQLEILLRQAVAEVDSGDGVLFLTDIPGGSPANRALNIIMDTPKTELLSGVNLPMITNAAFEREECSLSELVEALLEIGAFSLQDMRKQFEAALQAEHETGNKNGL